MGTLTPKSHPCFLRERRKNSLHTDIQTQRETTRVLEIRGKKIPRERDTKRCFRNTHQGLMLVNIANLLLGAVGQKVFFSQPFQLFIHSSFFCLQPVFTTSRCTGIKRIGKKYSHTRRRLDTNETHCSMRFSRRCSCSALAKANLRMRSSPRSAATLSPHR